MSKSRLEAFSDGVIAIIITIMVLELKVPHDTGIEVLRALIPIFISYVLSFIFVGIYWNNHHHLFQAVHKISGPVLWANLHLLFWLSLIPFTTGWMGEHCFDAIPVALYGVNLIFAAIAFTILTRALLKVHDKNSPLALAIGQDVKGKFSLIIYILAVPLAFLHTAFAYICYVTVALIWLVPDRRIEKVLVK